MKQERRKNEKGFTMVELIIVLAIMAILGAVLVPSFSKMTKKAQVTADITTVKSLQRIVDVYYVDNGNEFPSDIADGSDSSHLKANITPAELKSKLSSDGTYMKKDEEIIIKSGNLSYDKSKGHLCLNLYKKYKDVLKSDDQNVKDGWAKETETTPSTT